MPHHILNPIRAAIAVACLAVAGWMAAEVSAQVTHDPPMIYLEQTQPPPEPVEEPTTAMKVFQAISWYIPNRLGDLADIPRAYVTLGSGLGVSVRATQLFYFSHYNSEATAIGWNGRRSTEQVGGGTIFFGEQLDERYVGFLAAQEGRLQRDPSEIGVSLHLWAVGFNVAVSGYEAIDFLAGIFGIDLRGDDRGPVLFGDPTRRRE